MKARATTFKPKLNPKAILFLLFLSLTATVLKSQTKKEEADKLLDFKNYPAAMALYESLHKNDPMNGELNLRLAMCKYYLKHSPQSIYPFLLKAKESHVEALYYMGLLYHSEQRLEEEISSFQKYRNSTVAKKINDAEIVRLINIAKRAQEMIERPGTFTVENLGPVINTAAPEYAPALSLDERTLLFTSRREGTSGNKKDIYGNSFEDVYQSFLEKTGWTTPKNIGSPVNTDGNDASACLSVDGNNLIISRTNDGSQSGDLYLSVKQATRKWGTPAKLPEEVNTEFLELSASMTADNQIIYFSSNRSGGYGGFDIYRVVKLPDGKWSAPLNLGPTINSPQDEDCPFIHPDGQTLFFSSSGHSTMGGYDVFRSDLQYDGMWTEPISLGFPINSVNDEKHFVLSVDGKNGYFSSNRSGGHGDMDLYKVDINYNQPSMMVVSGYLRDFKDQKILLKGYVRMIDESNRIVPNAVYSSDSRTGKFIAICNPKFKYKMIVESDGYHPVIMDVVPAQLGNDDGSLLVDMTKK